MADLFHLYGGDLQISAQGDLLVTSQSNTGVQRLYRRLLTSPALSDSAGNPQSSADYTFHPTYGAGIGRRIGAPTDVPGALAVIRSQVRLESAVARNPEAQVFAAAFPGGVSVDVRYNDAKTNQPQTLNFDVNF